MKTTAYRTIASRTLSQRQQLAQQRARTISSQQQTTSSIPTAQEPTYSFSQQIINDFIDAGGKKLGREGERAARLVAQKYNLSDAQANALMERYGPQFRVYGARSPGAIAQAERMEEARAAGLPSTATYKQIEATDRPVTVTTMTEGPTYLPGIISQDIYTEDFIDKTKSIYQRAEATTSKYVTQPVFNAFRYVGIDLASAETQARLMPSILSPDFLGITGFGKAYKEFYGGVGAAIYSDIEQKPLKQVGLFGAGVVAGGVIRGVPLFSQVATRAVAGVTAGKVAGGVTKIGLTAGGVYLTTQYGLTKGYEYLSAGTPGEAGRVFGGTLKDVMLVGYGVKKGTLLAEKGYGYVQTYGMRDVTKLATDPGVESGRTKFVELEGAMKMSQAKRGAAYKQIFESQALSEVLGVKKGGIHAAPETTGTFGELTRALHIAPRASTAFTGISGSSYTSPTPKFSLSSIYTVQEPGLFYVEAPGGFKYVAGKEVQRGTYVFKGKLPGGTTAIIPGAKPEIEAVFVPSRTTGFTNVQFTPAYAKTLGVRVPFIAVLTPVAGGTPGALTTSQATSLISSYGFQSSGISSSSIGYVLSRPSASVSASVTSYTVSPSYLKTPSSSAPPSYPYKSYPGYSAPPSSSYPRTSRTPKSSIPISSYTPSPISYPSVVSSVPYRPSQSKIFPKTSIGYKPGRTLIPKIPKGRYTVEVRRFGQFKPIGTFGSLRQAFQVGRGKVVQTLAATFRIKGARQPGTPKGFYTRTTRKGKLFIQQPKLRLATGTERGEIQAYKRRRKKRR